MTLKSKLDRRAEQLLDATAAAQPAVPIDTQIDAFKAVSLYYLGTQRVTKGKPDTDDGPTFGDLIKDVKRSHTSGNA
jgi:hypothetical protein